MPHSFRPRKGCGFFLRCSLCRGLSGYTAFDPPAHSETPHPLFETAQRGAAPTPSSFYHFAKNCRSGIVLRCEPLKRIIEENPVRHPPYSRLSALCLVVLLGAADTDGGGRHQTTGRVIARDIYLSLPRTSSTPNVEILVLRTNEPIGGAKSSSHFAKVRYEDYADQHPLPVDLLEGKQAWRFSLRRNRSCDQVVSEGLFVSRRPSNELPKPGVYVLVAGADPSDAPPLHSTMPCFVLQPDGVKPAAPDR